MVRQSSFNCTIFAALLITAGCTASGYKSATYKTEKTAQLSSAGVAIFVDGRPEVAKPLEKALAKSLTARKVPATSMQQRFRTPPRDGQTLQQMAHAIGADVVLIGHAESGSADSPGDTQLKFVTFNAKTGENLLEEQLTYSGANSLGPERAAKRAAEQFGGEIASKLSPDSAEEKVQLATTAWPSPLKEGNRQAQRGNWAAAKQTWELALVRDPTNHKLLYNVGLANEALGNLEEAQKMFRRAARQNEKPTYQAAFDRVANAAQAANRRNPTDHFEIVR